MISLWILFVLFLLYFVVYDTWWGISKYHKIIADIDSGRTLKTKLYNRLMTGLWIPTGVVLILTAAGQFKLSDLGLSWFKLIKQPVFLYIIAALAVLYFLYLMYTLVVLRIYAIRKVSINQKMPDSVKTLLPVTGKEKKVWAFTAVTAGITEELLFRGFLFYVLGALFPGLNVFVILCISTLIFGVGHLYQGVTEAIKPMLLGFIFGLCFIAFGTIIPCIILHAMQDLCAVDLINENTSVEIQCEDKN